MKQLKKYFVVVGFAHMIFTSVVSAQEVSITRFTVAHLPRKAGYSKAQLNEDISRAKTKEDVKRIVRSKNIVSSSVIIEIQRSNGESSWWTINNMRQSDREANVVLQSKSSGTLVFYKLADFRNFFRDSVLIIDTLRVQLLINEARYPDDGFFVRYTGENNRRDSTRIPLSNGELLFVDSLLHPVNTYETDVQIFNSSSPDRSVASVKFIFMSEERKDELLGLARFLKEKNPLLSFEDLGSAVAHYADVNFAKPYLPQLLHWLDKSMQGAE